MQGTVSLDFYFKGQFLWTVESLGVQSITHLILYHPLLQDPGHHFDLCRGRGVSERGDTCHWHRWGAVDAVERTPEGSKRRNEVVETTQAGGTRAHVGCDPQKSGTECYTQWPELHSHSLLSGSWRDTAHEQPVGATCTQTLHPACI